MRRTRTERPWESPNDHHGDWYEIRAEFDRVLSASEVWQASGALGYALCALIVGESLSDPDARMERREDGSTVTVAYYQYDSTKSRRDDYHAAETFDAALEYIGSGSPVRTTDRAGAGTKDTRLCDGIGPVGVTFSVR